jgi:hypothetical protein
MGEYTGLIMFLWIVGAPAVGLLLLSLRQAPSRSYETTYVPPRREADRSVMP